MDYFHDRHKVIVLNQVKQVDDQKPYVEENKKKHSDEKHSETEYFIFFRAIAMKDKPASESNNFVRLVCPMTVFLNSFANQLYATYTASTVKHTTVIMVGSPSDELVANPGSTAK